MAQNTIKGEIQDSADGEPLVGATVLLKGTFIGAITDWDGSFIIKSDFEYPVVIEVSFIGYATQEITVSDESSIKVKLGSDAEFIETVEIKGRRITEKQRESPLTVESLDLVAIKETPAASFYDGLGALKDVDLTAASLGFKIINTRGFNSTSPVRSLQLIDGVDNQSPGLNFSLGNFLGASELDINKVDLVVGASSAFYGPGAFNGVISMQSKDPFFHKGIGVMLKTGERNLIEGALRWADAIKNKDGDDVFAFKLNAFALRANDWEAVDYGPIPGQISDETNPGRYDAVNIYGDEYQIGNDDRNNALTNPGLGVYYRSGYKEIDLVDYDTENLKLSASLHFRTNPGKTYESPEIVLASNYGGGTTVYQGDNRFSLKNIRFFQHRIEFKKKDKFFLRAYMTHEDAGDSYDPYFTAIKIQQAAKDNRTFTTDYANYWGININRRIKRLEGYPNVLEYLGRPVEYKAALATFLGGIPDSLTLYHQLALTAANMENVFQEADARYEPGTEKFDEVFNDITSRIASSEGGTRFYDKSALYHFHGEYVFDDIVSGDVVEDLDVRVGGNYRSYSPDSKGSILLDTNGRDLSTFEYGFYTGISTAMVNNKLRVNISGRMDKHENYDYLFSPAMSIVYSPATDNYIRVNFSSGVRNPTLTEQYLNYNVGPAILIGNVDGVNNLLTVDSYIDYLNSADPDTLRFFDIAPLQPEKVKTIEFGYRTVISKKLFVDAGYYYSWYDDFIGYQIGVDATFGLAGIPITQKVFRVSANSLNRVTTQGFSIGLNYFFMDKLALAGNYSYNSLNTKTDDPIIPAYNTPLHKYNIGISGREIPIFNPILFGFNFNYKWQEEFAFEGSPQFTGLVPAYGLLDGQVNWKHPQLNLTLKIGASNLLNTKVIQAFGGPVIGRFAYASIVYDFIKK
jgi:outer membrane receptor protein involved in Fe transport